MPDLLYEIGTEELPAGYLAPALAQLAADVERLLDESRLTPASVRVDGTPRRLVVSVRGIPEGQPPLTRRRVGPPARIAFDEDGSPTKAAEGFARSMGVAVESLEIEETKRGPYAVAVVEEPGRPATELLPELLGEATAAVPFPKSMHWEGGGFQFARPVRRLVALLDDQVVPVSVAGVQAGRLSAGHPFLGEGDVELADACYETYLDALREQHVIVDVEERRRVIREQINALMAPHGGALQDEALLAEVANMVEWPHAVEGAFDEHFLEVPAPVVVAAMKEHQRYFPVRDAAGELVPRFITVTNRTAEQEGLVREGNERVLLARLEDARFFWQQDSRHSLDDLVPRLEQVVFLGGLGSNLQRCERLSELGSLLAAKVGPRVEARHVQRAAHLCKADLLTGLVKEFPSLQGVVGRELALAHGEPEPVGDAIAEHYLPAGADDALPGTFEGSVLALADKLDVIAGCFALGLLPTGSQDPYALRRSALGILLIIERKGLRVDLAEMVEMARTTYRDHGIECDEEAAGKIADFFRERLYYAAIDRGHPHDFVRATLAAGHNDVKGFWDRLAALRECAGRPWWPALVELVDRTYRIQRDLDEIAPIRDNLLEEPLEKELARTLSAHREAVAARFSEGDYVGAADLYCSTFAQLVHDFFEDVFVNADDPDVRVNRKSLCGWVCRLFTEPFADLYLIESAQ